MKRGFIPFILILSAGLAVLACYILTLSRGVYPGISAGLVAYAAGLTPDVMPSHPVWTTVVRAFMHIAFGPAAFRLNLFSAIGGAVSTVLFGCLVARLLFRVAPAARAERLANDAPHNAKIAARVATVGGWTAALAYAFSVPAWAAATRLHVETFDALGVVVLALLLERSSRKPGPLLASLLGVICGAGALESPTLLLMSLAAALLFLVISIRQTGRWNEEGRGGHVRRNRLLALFAGCGAAGGLASLAWLWMEWRSTSGLPFSLAHTAAEALRAQGKGIVHGMPHSGWVWVLVFSFGPLAAAAANAARAFQQRSLFHILSGAVFTLTALLCLFNSALSPWGLAQAGYHLPILASMAVAATAGYLLAFCVALFSDRDGTTARQRLDLRIGRGAAFALGVPVLLAVSLSPVLNLPLADGRQGAFADRVARQILADLGERRWLASDGLLDPHLLVMARELRHPLRLLPAVPAAGGAGTRRIQRLIEADTTLGDIRDGLWHAALLGSPALVDEWVSSDPLATRHLAVLGSPQVWRMGGLQAVPQGWLMLGSKGTNELVHADLSTNARLFWTFAQTALDTNSVALPATAALQRELRRRAALSADELGVLLEDLGRPADAYEAYAAARQLDPRNLSAALNQFLLTQKGVRGNEAPLIQAQLGELLSAAGPVPSLVAVVRNFGEVRDPQFHARQGMTWLSVGQSEQARSELDRSLRLEPSNLDARRGLAVLQMNQGEPAASERLYRDVLASNPNDISALVGLATLDACAGRYEAAQGWLERAQNAGASADVLTVPKASCLAAAGKGDQAAALLHALTDNHPENLNAWSLLASIQLRRGEIKEVEQGILPAMVTAAGHSDNVLIHLVRADLFRFHKPVEAGAVRNALLHALVLRPDLADVRRDLLHLDMQVGDPKAIEQDASWLLRFVPDDAQANSMLATVLLQRGESGSATHYFRRALRADPSANSLNDLAECLRQRGKLAEAEELCRKALALDERSGAAWDTLACVLLDAKRGKEAADAAVKAAGLAPQNPYILKTLAHCLKATGRAEEAREALRPLLKPDVKLSKDLQPQVAALARELKL